jgi:hypothetical protein
MSIKAIETRYKGYRFRSRLEARWAVFFDALGIEWLYEDQGYVLPDGTCYLPDFFLPKLYGGMFVEVKPRGHDSPEARALARSQPYPVLLLDGVPESRVYYWVDSIEVGVGHGENFVSLGWDDWDVCFCDEYTLGSEHRMFTSPGSDLSGFSPGFDEKIRAAAAAARSARFEHGECPA